MPYSLPLPKKLRNEGWKVKIQDRESREDPHLTVWRKTTKWRINLRDKKGMERELEESARGLGCHVRECESDLERRGRR